MKLKAGLIGSLVLTAAPVVGLVVAGSWAPAVAHEAGVIRVATAARPVSKGTLVQAIAAAEQSSGGRVVEIRYRNRAGAPGFDAVAAKGGAFTHLRIDIPSNKVSTISQSEIPWRASWELKADSKSIAKAKVTLAAAVAKAENMSGSPAVDAGVAQPLEVGEAIRGYNVEVWQEGAPKRVVIDAHTGERISNPGPFLEPWEPEKNL